MFNIVNRTAAASDFDFVLSDGTTVKFVKVTNRDNIQVRLPDSHPLAAADPLRIFRPDGSHYKDELNLTLSATPKATPTPAPVANDDLTGNLVIIDGVAYTLTMIAPVVAELEAA